MLVHVSLIAVLFTIFQSSKNNVGDCTVRYRQIMMVLKKKIVSDNPSSHSRKTSQVLLNCKTVQH